MGKKKNKRMNESEFEQNEQHEFNDFGGEHESPVPYPEKFDREQLAMMDDDDLHKLGRFLYDSIQKVNRLHLNPYSWEVEMCYVQQEMQMRQLRRDAHAMWLGRAPSAPVVEMD